MNPVGKNQTYVKRVGVFVDAEDSEKRCSPNGLIEGCRENLTAVFTEADTGDTFTVSTLISPQTLTALDLPNLKKDIPSSMNK